MSDKLYDNEMDGHHVEITRDNVGLPGHEYEITLRVDGRKVADATGLEATGFPGPEDGGKPWATQLRAFAAVYVDGLNHA